MSASLRTIQHLRVTAAQESALRRWLPQLEDALRCASLPDPGARLLLVRHLNLGRLPQGVDSTALSRRLEQRFAETAARWVDGAGSDALQAEQVHFASALDARIELARRLLRGQRCDAWYWRAAVSEWRPGQPRIHALQAMLSTLRAWPEARIAVPAWAAAVDEADTQALLRALLTEAEQQAAALPAPDAGRPGTRRQAALHPDPASQGHSTGPSPANVGQDGSGAPVPPGQVGAPSPSAAANQDHRPLEHPGIDAGHRRALSSVAAQGSVANAPAAPVDGCLPRPSVAPTGAPTDRDASPNLQLLPSGTLERAPVATEARPEPDQRQVRPDGAQVAEPIEPFTRELAARPAAAAAPGELPLGAISRAAGLMFLLPVLARLGLPSACEAAGTAPRELSCAVLRGALRRLRVPPDDPAWALCPPTASPVVSMEPSDMESEARLWLTRSRHWLRRHARIGLASLVLRPGRIACTPTHIDLFFPLDAADLRVRRLGLDSDPGWLPWLGRVVQFHFDRCVPPLLPQPLPQPPLHGESGS